MLYKHIYSEHIFKVTKDQKRYLIFELTKYGGILGRKYEKNVIQTFSHFRFSVSESRRQLQKVDLQNLFIY